MTLSEFNKRFPTEGVAISYIIEKKYPNGEYVCPKCGVVKTKIYRQHYDPRKLRCASCMCEFSVLVGTIFEKTHLRLCDWFYAINRIQLSRKGVSALELQRELGMKSYESALRMMTKIREAIAKEDMREVFEALTEIDETYFGGDPRKQNKRSKKSTPPKKQGKKGKKKVGRGTAKRAIVGAYERSTGRPYLQLMKRDKKGQRLTGKRLLSVLNYVCKPGTKIMTDQYAAYKILDKLNPKNFTRRMINHKAGCSRGNGIHTNGIESVWAVIKRSLHGVYHHLSDEYLQSYLNEFAFRLCYRNCDEAFERLAWLAVQP